MIPAGVFPRILDTPVRGRPRCGVCFLQDRTHPIRDLLDTVLRLRQNADLVRKAVKASLVNADNPISQIMRDLDGVIRTGARYVNRQQKTARGFYVTDC